VFGAFNAWAHDDKHIEHYAYSGHEGGGPVQRRTQLDWLVEQLG
jgi:cephalosporin-C deacetylase